MYLTDQIFESSPFIFHVSSHTSLLLVYGTDLGFFFFFFVFRQMLHFPNKLQNLFIL